jgi:hypothetical protein
MDNLLHGFNDYTVLREGGQRSLLEGVILSEAGFQAERRACPEPSRRDLARSTNGLCREVVQVERCSEAEVA